MKREPNISIIIPTHNRADSLQATLDALCHQSYSFHHTEVIVVADGCTYDTMKVLQEYKSTFTLRYFEQPSRGPAAARNKGAEMATGELFIFMDDDIEASPSFVEAHVRAHEAQSQKVVIGYLPVVLENQKGFFRYELRTWWEQMFYPLREPGHRYRYTDLLTGNLSIDAVLFKQLGGFNPSFWCHEDYEFGLRLIKAGATFGFAPDAIGYHHEVTDLRRSLARKFQEGRADIQMGYCHPELRSRLLLAGYNSSDSSRRHLMRRLAFKWPKIGDVLAVLLLYSLGLFEWARLRGRWRRVLNDLLGYWYWRGVAVEIKTPEALADFVNEIPSAFNDDTGLLAIDLHEGVEAAEGRLDAEQPFGVKLTYGQQLVGNIWPEPGFERLRGIHLRPLLTTTFSLDMLRVLTAVEPTTPTLDTEQLVSRFLIHYWG
jgi:glycosyltransferase involved in cell wall biosynthesis